MRALSGMSRLLPWLLLLALAGCREEPGVNLLLGRAPLQAHGVQDVERLTDGQGMPNGSPWLGARSAELVRPGANALFDLGAPTPLGCLWLQGDNNDDYLVGSSLDGRSFTPLWVAGPVPEGGLQLREANLEVNARYLSVSAQGGDGHYSLSEFGAAEHCPQGANAFIERALDPLLLARWQWFGGLLLALVTLFAGRVAPRPLVLTLATLALDLLGYAAFGMTHLQPLFALEPLIRAAVAVLAAGIAVREAFVGRLSSGQRRSHSVVLLGLAGLSLACYYHFGVLQFRDEGQQRQTFVHATDMRHYFPLAKYFDELRFDGMYLASVAA